MSCSDSNAQNISKILDIHLEMLEAHKRIIQSLTDSNDSSQPTSTSTNIRSRECNLVNLVEAAIDENTQKIRENFSVNNAKKRSPAEELSQQTVDENHLVEENSHDTRPNSTRINKSKNVDLWTDYILEDVSKSKRRAAQSVPQVIEKRKKIDEQLPVRKNFEFLLSYL